MDVTVRSSFFCYHISVNKAQFEYLSRCHYNRNHNKTGQYENFTTGKTNIIGSLSSAG